MTSELYLDPLSAVVLRQVLERAPLGVGVFPLLASIAATPDLPPLFLRSGEEPDLLTRYTDEAEELLVKPEEAPLELDLDGFLATLKTASVLEAWINEVPIIEITRRYGLGAGDLRTKVEDAEWLLFAAGRLASRFQRRLGRTIDDLSLRVRYGAGEELLDLVRLRGIGRVRARLLFRAGYPDRESLRQAPLSRIAQVLRSPALAEMVTSQLRRLPGAARTEDETLRRTPARPLPPSRPTARTLEDFPSDPER
jgi:helicase